MSVVSFRSGNRGNGLDSRGTRVGMEADTVHGPHENFSPSKYSPLFECVRCETVGETLRVLWFQKELAVLKI